MEITKVLSVTDRKDWRSWLQKHYKTEPDIWLRLYKKASGKISISYNDAVEEALCFGWIDSIVKSYDKESFVQRFSPRKAKTPYSPTNIIRLKKLIKEKKVIQEVLKTLGVLFFFLFFFASSAAAQTSWVITNFHSDIAIKETGMVAVDEKISVDFQTLEKHGIYRDIPVVYQNDSGEKTYTKIDVTAVEQDGQKAKYELITNENNIRIRIGDPDRTINGEHTYQIHYKATGVLRPFSNYDELYWNVTGNQWEADIEQASATVSLPKDQITKTVCFEGYPGYTNACNITPHSSRIVTFTATRNLPPTQGLTIGTQYTKGMVPLLTVAPPKKLIDDIVTPLSLVSLLLALIGGTVGIFLLWMKQGRDFWYKTQRLLNPNAKEETMPLGAHETIVVEFEPPEQLRPAELGILMDQRADTLDVTATIIDLANRGFLTIKDIEKKWLFGKKDYELHRTEKAENTLMPYESLLLKKLFAGGKTITLSSLKTKFYTDLAEVKKVLYKDVMDKKLFIAHPEKTRNIYLGIGGAVLAVGGVFMYAGFQFTVGPFVMFGLGVTISGILLLISASTMPRRSALGRELYQRARGYHLFISGAEKYRQQFFEKKNMFNEVLPYSIVFGLTDKFAKAMKDMGVTPTQPTWYTSSHAFIPSVFASDVNSFSQSFSNAIASTPSSSGSSGGSSGGGFGGGGGGSW